jgi:poly(A) polymerase
MKISSFPGDIPRTPAFLAAQKVAAALRAAGHKAYFVGGAVRDLLLGRTPDDVDVTTSARPEAIEALFDKAIPIGAAFGIITVVVDGIPVEVATFRAERGYSDGRRPDHVVYTDDEVLDVTRRDFTVNGLLLDPAERTVVDCVGGLDDLRAGVLRTIGDPVTRFGEDHLRILRLVRFASKLGFTVDPVSEQAAADAAEKLRLIAAERIRAELEKILLGPYPAEGFEILARLGILKVILPEVDAMRGVEQPKQFHPEGDVFVHTMLLLRHAAWRTPALMWSALLHDVGKPGTQTFKDGVPHFYGHEALGADMAAGILARLRLPSAMIDCITAAIRHHMRFASVHAMKKAKWMRIIADPNFPVELELHRLDCIACHGLLDNYVLMLDRMREYARLPAPTKPFLTGDDIIALGLKPGAVFRRILGEAEDLRLEGELKSREQALDWLRARVEHLDL